MKKVLSLLALLVVVLFSCTKDENNEPTIEKTNVIFNVTSSTKTNRQIERGSIPLYVDNLTIKAESRALSPYTAQENFTFTGGVTSNAPALILENVALGKNTFSASSKSAENTKIKKLELSSLTNLTTLKSKTPYIPCFSTNNPEPEIIKGVNPPVTLIMNSNHGRIISLFQVSGDAAKYVIVIKAYINGSTTALSTVQIRPETSERGATFEWSDVDAINGATVRFEILICESVSNTVLHTINKDLILQKEKSLSCIYTIGTNDVKTDIESGGILITFPKIEEIECDYDSEGYNCHGRDKNGYNRQGFNRCGWHKGPNPFYDIKHDENPENGNDKCGN